MRNPICQLCKRHKSANSVCVYGQSFASTKNVMVIIDKIAYSQDNQDAILVGQGGSLLIKLFSDVGLLNQSYFTAAAKCYVGSDNDKPKINEIRACRIYLEQEIEEVKPSLIICLGQSAAAILFDKFIPLKDLRQRIFEYKGIKVGITYSHNIIFVDPNKYNQLQKDLQWIVNNVSPKEEPKLDYVMLVEQPISNSNVYGLDIETFGDEEGDSLNYNKAKLLTLAVANPNNKTSIVFDINHSKCFPISKK